MQMNPFPIVSIDIECENVPTICACSHGNEKKVCSDCKCHLRIRQTQDIVIPIPSPRIQLFGYGIIVATVTIVGVYMLLQAIH